MSIYWLVIQLKGQILKMLQLVPQIIQMMKLAGLMLLQRKWEAEERVHGR